MGSTDGQHLGFDLSHVIVGHRRAVVRVEAGCDAAPSRQGSSNLPPHPLRRTHHPGVGEQETVFWWR